MATIKQQGKGYKITVSAGFDIHGTRIREHMTWIPEPGMTKRQIEKELNRQAVLFEDHVKSHSVVDSSILFSDFLDLWMERHVKKRLKIKTAAEYEKLLPHVKTALGHIKLKDLRPRHLNSFYCNMQESGMRRDQKYTVITDLQSFLRKAALTKAELHRRSGVSLYSIDAAVRGEAVTKSTAEAICDELGKDLDELFTISSHADMLSGNTVRHYHTMISSCLGKAVKWEYLSINPAANADPPSIEQKEASHLEVDEAKELLRLLDDMPIKYRAAITFDLISGLRRGELLGLSWSNIKAGDQLIRITQTLYYVKGYGLFLDTPKNKTSGRYLRLPQIAFALLNELKHWQEQQAAMLGDAWENKYDLVFTNDFGGPIHPDTLTKWFSTFRKKHNLPDVHVHSLRHTYASLMISDGVPLVVVSKRMGHAQVSTTANIYTHVISSADEKATHSTDVFNDMISLNSELSEENDNKVIRINPNSGTKVAPN